ncbi:hypothetical protein BSLA_03r1459 [Burkholderia stabilis]|nr:hypothetical protein BSLA_03r1459 [Burkholderia stabilis]
MTWAAGCAGCGESARGRDTANVWMESRPDDSPDGRPRCNRITHPSGGRAD